jgi:hypothetical protein
MVMHSVGYSKTGLKLHKKRGTWVSAKGVKTKCASYRKKAKKTATKKRKISK